MLSGIGDETHLRDNGIEVVHHSKGVGKNLQDHLETYIQQKCKTPNTLYTYTKLIPKILAGMQWFMFKSGPCSKSFLEASKNDFEQGPDLNINHCIPAKILGINFVYV